MSIDGKTILITGGTGFLGRALAREMLKRSPKSIRVYSRDEAKHHVMQEEFKGENRLRYLVGDVRDVDRLKKAASGCDVVIHAAALKRIDMIEYNVAEAIKTNVLGTMNVVDACLDADVEKAVFISTDKACMPVNTYGACKFVGERVFTESNYSKGNARTAFTCVRYGNVLESTGSVIPFFMSKIRDGKPVPVTDKRMTRFMISPAQAVELVFHALEHAVGGEIFVPAALPAFNIVDLVHALASIAGATPSITITGSRPGEKLHEVLVNDCEIPRAVLYDGLYVVTSEIGKYITAAANPVYLSRGVPVPEGSREYCSKDAVICASDLEKLLRRFGVV